VKAMAGGAALTIVGVACACFAIMSGTTTAMDAARVALSLTLAAVAACLLRLHPRGCIDISWCDLFAAFRYAVQDFLTPNMFKGGTRSLVEASICRSWSSRGDGFVSLSVRSGMDLALEVLNLEKDSEVLFAPGISIPAVVKLVEARGLRARGLEPHSISSPLPRAEDLEANL